MNSIIHEGYVSLTSVLSDFEVVSLAKALTCSASPAAAWGFIRTWWEDTLQAVCDFVKCVVC